MSWSISWQSSTPAASTVVGGLPAATLTDTMCGDKRAGQWFSDRVISRLAARAALSRALARSVCSEARLPSVIAPSPGRGSGSGVDAFEQVTVAVEEGTANPGGASEAGHGCVSTRPHCRIEGIRGAFRGSGRSPHLCLQSTGWSHGGPFGSRVEHWRSDTGHAERDDLAAAADHCDDLLDLCSVVVAEVVKVSADAPDQPPYTSDLLIGRPALPRLWPRCRC